MNEPSENPVSPKTIEQVYRPVTRRTFLKGTAGATLGMAGVCAALSPLLDLERGTLSLEQLLQKHYRELKPDEMQRILARLAEKTEKEYGIRPNLRDIKPMQGTQFGYALNLTRCIGCRRCAHACLKENNQSREDDADREMSYIRVLEMKHGAIDLETSNAYYDPPAMP